MCDISLHRASLFTPAILSRRTIHRGQNGLAWIRVSGMRVDVNTDGMSRNVCINRSCFVCSMYMSAPACLRRRLYSRQKTFPVRRAVTMAPIDTWSRERWSRILALPACPARTAVTVRLRKFESDDGAQIENDESESIERQIEFSDFGRPKALATRRFVVSDGLQRVSLTMSLIGHEGYKPSIINSIAMSEKMFWKLSWSKLILCKIILFVRFLSDLSVCDEVCWRPGEWRQQRVSALVVSARHPSFAEPHRNIISCW